MVSGPLEAPPSFWKTGKSEPDRLAWTFSKGLALWFWKARKARREARVGIVRMVGARKGGRRVFFSDSGRAWPGAGSLHHGWGSQLALTSWARDPRPYSLFPRVPIPLSFPSFWRARARELSTPSLPLCQKRGGGKEPNTKAQARPLPSRQGVAGARPCSLRVRAGSCGSTAVGRVSVSPSFGFFCCFLTRAIR